MCRVFIMVWCLLFCSGVALSQQPAAPLALGDNIVTYSLQHPAKTKNYYEKLTNWKEGNVYIGLSDSFYHPGDIALFFAGGDVIAAFRNNKGEQPYFLLDMDGDSILDLRSDHLVLPYWVVKKRSRIEPADHLCDEILNTFYKTQLQADSFEENDDRTYAIDQTDRFPRDSTLNNRYIIYLLLSYNESIQHTQNNEISLAIINSLDKEFTHLYHSSSPLVLIFKIELLMSMDRDEEARKLLLQAIKLYPKSIPMLVDDCRLEPDEAKKKKKKDKLKREYPHHWMVQTI